MFTFGESRRGIFASQIILLYKSLILKYENSFNDSFPCCYPGTHILFHRIFKRKQKKAGYRGGPAVLYYRRLP